ncbi:MAG: ZIP family metal transporter [Paludibacter sp.]|jgi:zinc and cadmium transporter|nr:ZIP family metal transporter [Paludibacter sp.]
MDQLLYTIIALLAASVGSVSLSGSLLLLNNKWLGKVSNYLLYLAGGTLLGAAMLGLIPEATETLEVHVALAWVLGGILFFFLLEKVILWRMCHDENCERQVHAAGPMIIIGDAVHNAIDGVVIAASFLTSTELGIFVTLSVLLHEIPQELGDFGILIKSGYPRKKALLLNLLSGSSALVSGVAAYFLLEQMEAYIPYALTIAAASFMYVAMADLIPEMHKETKPRESAVQLILILAGVALIAIAVAGHSHAGHAH